MVVVVDIGAGVGNGCVYWDCDCLVGCIILVACNDVNGLTEP